MTRGTAATGLDILAIIAVIAMVGWVWWRTVGAICPLEGCS
jgi:hypothetical protein